jgi:8-oxo-dGTP pyrophosphatase MutT (NUDIX family)
MPTLCGDVIYAFYNCVSDSVYLFTMKLKDHHQIENKNVTCVLVIAFTADFDILTVTNKRGVDIPGGHIEVDDVDFEATARREVWEEARAIVGELTPCGVLECTHDDHISYMMIMTGFVDRLENFVPHEEVSARAIMPVAEFLSSYRAADPELMWEMIKQAKASL